jgi:hypothetical protein
MQNKKKIWFIVMFRKILFPEQEHNTINLRSIFPNHHSDVADSFNPGRMSERLAIRMQFHHGDFSVIIHDLWLEVSSGWADGWAAGLTGEWVGGWAGGFILELS